jgi:hypothetical protein
LLSEKVNKIRQIVFFDFVAQDSRLWREIEVALPREFNLEEQIDAVRGESGYWCAESACGADSGDFATDFE